MHQISAETFKFMADLWVNNSKGWFDKNRTRYEQHVHRPMKAIAESLAEPVAVMLPEFSGKPKLSRINNDIRFTANKPLYKEHMWISFGSKTENSADLFSAIGHNGWATGCGIGAPKREPLDTWRRNLLEYRDVWRKYSAALELGEKVLTYFDKFYKKSLFPDTPEDLEKLVQAKSIWIVEASKTTFKDSPEVDFFRGLCRMLPVYLFMFVPTNKLPERLLELGSQIKPPDAETDRLWRTLEGC